MKMKMDKQEIGNLQLHMIMVTFTLKTMSLKEKVNRTKGVSLRLIIRADLLIKMLTVILKAFVIIKYIRCGKRLIRHGLDYLSKIG